MGSSAKAFARSTVISPDRGPQILDSVWIARNMVEHGSAYAVPGNHDLKLVRALRGRDVQITHGLDRSLAELDALPQERRPQARDEVVRFLDGLVSHYVFDDGNLVVAHAGLKQEMQGRGSGKVRDFALYGETTGEPDEFGLPVRWNWAAEYPERLTAQQREDEILDIEDVLGKRLISTRFARSVTIREENAIAALEG